MIHGSADSYRPRCTGPLYADQPVLLLHRRSDGDARRRSPRSGAHGRHCPPSAQHLSHPACYGDHHAGRDLLRGHVRGFDDFDPGQYPRRGGRSDHLSRRPSDGIEGTSGTGPRHGCLRFLYRRNDFHHRPDARSAAAGEVCAGLRAAGIFRPDAAGHDGADLPGCGVHAEGPDDGRLRPADQHDRHGQHFRHPTPDLRHPRIQRRSGIDPGHHGALRRGRGHLQSGAGDHTERGDHQGPGSAAQPSGLEKLPVPDPAGVVSGILHRHSPRACAGHLRLQLLRDREKALQTSGAVRHRGDRGCGRSGVGQQCRYRRGLHPALHAGNSLQLGHRGPAGGLHDLRHPARTDDDRKISRSFLGHGHQHVSGECNASGFESAPDRPLGPGAEGSLSHPLPHHSALLHHRGFQLELQLRGGGPDDRIRRLRLSGTEVPV